MTSISALFHASLAVTFCFVSTAYAQKYSINVAVTGAEPDEGQILVSLFDSPTKYMKAPLAESRDKVNGNGTASSHFNNHDPGEYAVVVIYDQNGNGELDLGLLGIPKEKIGFSNNANTMFGPARWKAARFSLSDSNLQIVIQLKGAKSESQ